MGLIGAVEQRFGAVKKEWDRRSEINKDTRNKVTAARQAYKTEIAAQQATYNQDVANAQAAHNETVSTSQADAIQTTAKARVHHNSGTIDETTLAKTVTAAEVGSINRQNTSYQQTSEALSVGEMRQVGRITEARSRYLENKHKIKHDAAQRKGNPVRTFGRALVKGK